MMTNYDSWMKEMLEAEIRVAEAELSGLEHGQRGLMREVGNDPLVLGFFGIEYTRLMAESDVQGDVTGSSEPV